MQPEQCTPGRGGFAVSGPGAGRALKAQKIHGILERYRDLTGARLLDVGAGSCEVVGWFKDNAGCDVAAVDMRAMPERRMDIGFQVVEGTDLPFPSGAFDVVIYNHVIEHVGERPEQAAHLREIYRVLAPGGLLYLAVPNQWTVMEPHYGLAFLSWLPGRVASAYMRFMKRGSWYDCRPFARSEIKGFVGSVGFSVTDETPRALDMFLTAEGTSAALKVAKSIPSWGRSVLMPVVPTIVLVGRKP